MNQQQGPLLEICANSFDSALAAERGGADRIELCENLNEGGTTPSHGTISLTTRQLNIPVYVLIRPRAGNFVYSDEEFNIMKADVEHCKALGCQGVVIGLLKPDGTVDRQRTAELVRLAQPMGVTFHRAFDGVPEISQALEAIIESGCERILTSGLHNTAMEGAAVIRELRTLAGGRIKILAGSGVNPENITELARLTMADEFHSSAKENLADPEIYHNPKLEHMGTVTRTSEQIVRSIRKQLESV